MGGAEGVAVVHVCARDNFCMCTCVCAVISECHKGRRLVVVLHYSGTCITFIDAPSFLEKHL